MLTRSSSASCSMSTSTSVSCMYQVYPPKSRLGTFGVSSGGAHHPRAEGRVRGFVHEHEAAREPVRRVRIHDERACRREPHDADVVDLETIGLDGFERVEVEPTEQPPDHDPLTA